MPPIRIRRSQLAGPSVSVKRHFPAFAAMLVILASGTGGSAEEALRERSEYADAIGQAQADLDGGRVLEARQRLEATDKALRSFEYEYLFARVQAAADTEVAPDLVRMIAGPEVDTRYAVLNTADRQLVFLCRDGRLRIHDLSAPESPERTVSLDGRSEGSPLWSGAFSRDGATFVAGHESGEVVVWDAKSWTVRHVVSLGAAWPVRELVVAPDGTALVAESKAALELWSLADEMPRKVADIAERYNFGEGVAFSPRGDQLATGGMFDIVLHDAATGEKTQTMQHASYTMGLVFSPDGTRIASAPRGNVNKFLAVFELTEGKPLFNAGPFADYIAGMDFTPDGKRIAATSCEKVLRVFDAASGEVLLTLDRPSCGAKPAFTQDGRLLGWSEPDGYRYIELQLPP